MAKKWQKIAIKMAKKRLKNGEKKWQQNGDKNVKKMATKWQKNGDENGEKIRNIAIKW